ncbi:hypothetical protein [Streptomyces sp. B1I3]|uniref:hypothetical protein n=1 Tax=Streptomyces sp. B1I3 TaxID=3042264 RepID=UPI0027D91D14|nr:hypothetical protein [Streptomyces sp. B1I3]
MNRSPAMSRSVQGGLTVAALVLIPLLAVAGSDGLRATLDFTTGVLTLVSLTAAVAWGLLATDRLFLSTRQRLIAQGIHRAAAVASLGFLLLHGTVKVALGHVELLGALIPFGLGFGGTAGLIGFGSLAGLLMIVAAATGAMRSAFATPGRIAGRWRALHALAYPAWCFALVHGLYAGRQPATWVVVMYMLCLLAAAAALGLRLLPGPARRLITELVTALIRPDLPPAPDSDPAVRTSPLPGADHVAPFPRQGLPPDAPGWGDDGHGRGYDRRDGHGWGDEGHDVRATPVRPRTLAAPAPPSFAAPDPAAPSYTPPPFEPAPFEPPPRSSERLDHDFVRTYAPPSGAESGIFAAYRAVSRPAAQPPDGRTDDHWPAPSPAPPAWALGPSYPPDATGDAGHAYSQSQEPAAYGRSGEPSAYGRSGEPAAYGSAPEASAAHPFPAADPAGRGGGPVRYDAETEQLPGPLYPPPAGEPWHAPAGDRP